MDLAFDALIAETARALRRDADLGEARVRRLERDAEMANLREYAKQVALFAITPDSAARACSRLEAATAQGRRLYERAAWLDYGDDLPAHTVAATRDIADFWREILATTPDPDE